MVWCYFRYTTSISPVQFYPFILEILRHLIPFGSDSEDEDGIIK